MQRTNYGMLKTLLLGIITFGIYPLVIYCRMTDDVNLVCRKDGKHTMHYALLFFLVGPITLGIADLVWNNNICARMHNQLEKDKIDYNFGAGTFWGWGFFGALIIVGPFIFMHKRFKAMNLLNDKFNKKEAKRERREELEDIEDE